MHISKLAWELKFGGVGGGLMGYDQTSKQTNKQTVIFHKVSNINFE